MVDKLKGFRVSESLMPIISIFYGLLVIGLIFTGFFGFFFEIAYMFIGYLVYKRGSGGFQDFWRAWMTSTIIGFPVTIVGFLIFPILGLLLAVVSRIALLYFYSSNHFIGSMIVTCTHCKQRNKLDNRKRQFAVAKCGNCKHTLF